MDTDFQVFSSLRYDPALRQLPGSSFTHAGWNYANASPLYMLDFHRDRMLRAVTHWAWDAAITVLTGDEGLNTIESLVLRHIRENNLEGSCRVKVTLNKDGKLGVEASAVPEMDPANLYPLRLPTPGAVVDRSESELHLPLKTPEYEVLIADLGTTPSEYTHFKTTRREMYNMARQRAHISLPDKKEVLLVNEDDGSIMEGSLTTPYFWRDGRWVTPPVSQRYSPKSGSGGQDGTSRRWALECGIAVESIVTVTSLVDGEDCWLSNGVRGFFFGRIKLDAKPVQE